QVFADVHQEAVLHRVADVVGFAGRIAFGNRPVVRHLVRAVVVHDRAQLAVHAAHAAHPVLAELHLQAQDQLVLVHRLQVGVDHAARVGGGAVGGDEPAAELRTG